MRSILVFIFCCCLLNSNAQDSTKTWKCAITWKPLGIINPVLPNLTAGALLKVNKNFLIELQAGYIYNYRPSSYLIYEKRTMQGWKGNLEFKYLLYEGFYAGCQVFYNAYQRNENVFFNRYANTYQELILTEKRIATYVIHLKGGALIPLIENKLLFEIFGGLGARYKMVNMLNVLPDDATSIERRGVNFSTDEPGNQLYPSITAGFSLGYIIK
jgi:hypothetical protein